MFDEYFEERNYIFNYKKFYFKVERLKLLSEEYNFNQAVYKYKISYFSKKNDKLKKELIMVGKTIKTKEQYIKKTYFDDPKRVDHYFEILKILKISKAISYSVRRFKELENVECVNFEKKDLYNLIFMKDFNIDGEVFPINEGPKFNSKIIEKKGEDVWMVVFERIMSELVFLTKRHVYLSSLDIWLVIFNGNNFELEIVDVDFMYFVKFVDRDNISELLVNVSEHLSKFINEDNFYRYKEIIERTFNPFLREMELVIEADKHALCFDVVELY